MGFLWAWGVSLLVSVAGGAESTTPDRPLRIHQNPPLYYPESTETQEYPTGEVSVMVQIDPQGKLVDAMVTRYSHRTFADTALKALRLWHFDPPVVNGEKRGIRQELSFRFSVEGMAVNRTAAGYFTERANSIAGVYTHRRLAREEQLDAPLTAVNQPEPRPVPLREPARVAVDFYVDEAGLPRMPVIVEADDRQAGASSLEAILQWRFEPPQTRGRPAVVRASQVFVFDPGEAEATAEEG